MAEHQYYPEEVLIEKMERGQYGWLDYVNHFSPEWQEEYTQIPYPFAKYDLIILPGFQFGGMEHTGATLYTDGRMFLNENRPPSSSTTRTNNWKRRWRAETHNGNLFNNGLWRYERIPTPE